MLRRSLLITLLLLWGSLLYVLTEYSRFIRAYWLIIVFEHGVTILIFLGVLFANVSCLIYLVLRWARLTETGRKLAHVEKELLTGESISEELAKRLRSS